MKSSPKKSSKNFKASEKSSDANTPHNNRRKSPPKKSTIESSPKDQVKEMFIKWFKKNNSVGYVMSKQDVVRNILTKLDAKQEDSMEEVMKELKNEGFIEIQEDGLTLVLTQKGAETFKKMTF